MTNTVPLYLYQSGLVDGAADGVMVASDGSMTMGGESFFGPLDYYTGEEYELALLEAKALDEGRDPETAW